VVRTLQPAGAGTQAVLRKDETTRRRKRKMDAKKLAGMMVAVLLAVPIIANAQPEMLAAIDFGLVGLLLFLRRRRIEAKASRYGR
jgi:hypothetical protein